MVPCVHQYPEAGMRIIISRRLTQEDATEIHRRHANGEAQHRIAVTFDVNQRRISQILSGKRFPAAKRLARLRLGLTRHVLAFHWTARIPARSDAHVNALDHERAGTARSNDHDRRGYASDRPSRSACVRHWKFDAFACSLATQAELAEQGHRDLGPLQE